MKFIIERKREIKRERVMSSFTSMIGLGCVIGVVAIYFVNKYPGEPTEYVLDSRSSNVDVVATSFI